MVQRAELIHCVVCGYSGSVLKCRCWQASTLRSPRCMSVGEPELIVYEKYPDGRAGENEWEIRTCLHLAT
jgi:hypothetical protein